MFNLSADYERVLKEGLQARKETAQALLQNATENPSEEGLDKFLWQDIQRFAYLHYSLHTWIYSAFFVFAYARLLNTDSVS